MSFCIISQSCRNDPARTDGYTTSAVDTRCLFAGCDLVFCHAQDRRRCLDNRNIQRNQWDSHHRTSGDDFLRFGSKTSRLFDQFPEVRTGADTQVLRFFDRISGDRHHFFHDRSAKMYRLIDCMDRVTVVDYTSCICRKHGRIDLSSCDCKNKLSLCSLRILGF